MKQSLPVAVRSVFLFILLFTGALKAQQNPVITLQTTGVRMPLDVQAGETKLRVCGLKPGMTYKATASKVIPEQPAKFELRPTGWMLPGTPPGLQQKNKLRFTAAAECEELILEAGTTQHSTALPLFLSVYCENCPNENRSTEKEPAQADQVNLSVAPAVPAESLIRNTLVGGNCFEVTNITSSGPDSAFGTFNNGSSTIGIQNGLVMCTGNVSMLPGPNDEVSESGNYDGDFGSNAIQDPDLATLTPFEQYDVVKLEFDFTPTANKVQFEYVFGSEEYCEYVQAFFFNDAFGFFISGPGINGTQNLALLPNSNTPVSVNNVNFINNTQYYVNNSQTLFDLVCLFEGAANLQDIQLDGWTTPLTATVDVIPCETYHIKLVLADITDELVASAVFLRANSFDAGGTAKAEAVYAAGQTTAFEDCPISYIRFSRDSSDISLPLEVNFTVSGSAVPGTDYAPLNSPVVIPAGQQEVLIPVVLFEDNTSEGQENIIVSIDNACSCEQAEVEFLIQDKPPVILQLPVEEQSLCEGQSLLFTAQAGGGVPPFSYLWNTGDSTATVLLTTEGFYVVSATDFCGSTGTDSVFARFTPLPVLNDTILFCPGDSVNIDGVSYTGPGIVLDTLQGTNGSCDTLVTYVLELLPRVTLSDTIQFCLGDSVNIGGIVYSAAGTVIDTLPGSGAGCDTIIQYTLLVLEPPTRAETVLFCPGSSVTIGGNIYTGPGIVTDTLPTINGTCDTVITYTLALLPYPTSSETLALCPGESVTIGGISYTAPGAAVDTLPGVNGGCDTIVTYTLELLPHPVRAKTIEFCPGESVIIGGTAYNLPGTVIDTVPASLGCDTIVTYTLEYLTPAPSNVSIVCPNNIEITASGPAAVNFTPPVADSDCICPGVAVQLTGGLPPGSVFPTGATTVCYLAADSCGNTATCCFTVTLSETKACDVKTIGCIRYELLSITQDPEQRTTYRIRVTNNCGTELIYAAFELPGGIVATDPAHNSIYTAPGGQAYTVRNPNYSPFYSIRYFSAGTGISGGASDIFEYTLPPRSFPNYIHVIAKVATQTYYEAYLNTFYCPVGKTPSQNRGTAQAEMFSGLHIFPNPALETLFADLSDWQNKAVTIRAFDSRGALVLQHNTIVADGLQEVQLPEGLSEGLYFLEVRPENGEKQVARFVVRQK